MATLMLWNSTTEEDRDQQCPQSHPFAFDKVKIFKFFFIKLNVLEFLDEGREML